MSLVIATPQLLATAALDLASIGSQVSAANAAAAMPTTEVVAAAADEVSAAIAGLFGAMLGSIRRSAYRWQRFTSSLCRR